MNRRQLLNSATCLIPGASLLEGSIKTAASFPTVDPSVSRFGEEEASLASRNTEEVVMELLHICLERIHWQGEVSEWNARLLQVIERIQSLIEGQGPGSEGLLMTAHQMDMTADLCRAAQTGIKEKILECALRLCDACLPFRHWIAGGFQIGKGAPLAELAFRHPEVYSLMHSAVRRIPYDALNRQIVGEGRACQQD